VCSNPEKSLFERKIYFNQNDKQNENGFKIKHELPYNSPYNFPLIII
jgi:hypothetical protein